MGEPKGEIKTETKDELAEYLHELLAAVRSSPEPGVHEWRHDAPNNEHPFATLLGDTLLVVCGYRLVRMVLTPAQVALLTERERVRVQVELEVDAPVGFDIASAIGGRDVFAPRYVHKPLALASEDVRVLSVSPPRSADRSGWEIDISHAFVERMDAGAGRLAVGFFSDFSLAAAATVLRERMLAGKKGRFRLVFEEEG
jgi:hypothetical protein